ncbi:MAG: SH3 domain-containing protein [Clostridia bacterium]|nr:SH3 domain-containing protein [Clostridia bacterium]
MKKKIIVSMLMFMLLFVSVGGMKAEAMTYYENVNFVTGMVTASALNVRSGPGTKYSVIGVIYKNEYVRVFAKVGDWYVIQTNNDLIGAVSTKYIKNATSSGTGTNMNTNTGTKTNTNTNTNTGTDNLGGYSAEEKELLELINEQRRAYGLSNLVFDSELQRVAKAKAQDLVANNYFSHNSPTYGSPFDMMKSFGISYKTAGENIAGNSTLKGAVTAWMNSSGHRENILNNAYNYTGIGIVDSPKYGKVMVQMFIGK